MPHFLLELYLPRERALDPDALAQGAHRAAQQEDGVRFVRSLVLPDEELCFHVFDAPTVAAVAAAGAYLGMRFERVVEVFEVSALSQEDRR